MTKDDDLDWFWHPEEFSKKEYLKKVRAEVADLRAKVSRLEAELIAMTEGGVWISREDALTLRAILKEFDRMPRFGPNGYDIDRLRAELDGNHDT